MRKTTQKRSRSIQSTLLRKPEGVGTFFRAGVRPKVQAKCDACGTTGVVRREEEEEAMATPKLQRQEEKAEEVA